ncbi:hypothetical protein ACO0SA_002859 [Hanseniaspora valbyensis]
MVNESFVYFDININTDFIGRIVFTLYDDKAPKTAENFKQLCQRSSNGYSNTLIHRIIKNFMIQAGDITYGSLESIDEEKLGTGGESIYENSSLFEDENSSDPENFKTKIDNSSKRCMKLAMANHGEPNTNKSQFFILTADDSSHLIGKHSVFGEVYKGMEIVRILEGIEVDKNTGFPKALCFIKEAGAWSPDMGVPYTKGCNFEINGDIFEEFPIDEFSIGEDDFQRAYEVVEIIKNSGSQLFKNKDFKNACYKYLKSLRYLNEYIPDIDTDQKMNLLFKKMKITLYLNLALSYINDKNFDLGGKFCDYIINNEIKLKPETISKAHYRKSLCLIHKLKYDDALKELKKGLDKSPNDKNILKKIEAVESLKEQETEKQRKKMSKFFS